MKDQLLLWIGVVLIVGGLIGFTAVLISRGTKPPEGGGGEKGLYVPDSR